MVRARVARLSARSIKLVVVPGEDLRARAQAVAEEMADPVVVEAAVVLASRSDAVATVAPASC